MKPLIEQTINLISKTSKKTKIEPAKKGQVIAFDLDGTIAYYTGFKGYEHIGEPIKPMVDLLKNYLEAGYEVVIFTARVGNESEEENTKARGYIEDWCMDNIGEVLPVTATKSPKIIRFYDDRAKEVILNKGIVVGD